MAKQCLDCGKNIPEYMTYCPQCGDKRGIKTTVVKTNTVEPEKEEPSGRCNPITAYIRMFKKYSTMQGRSRRSEYWYAYITDLLIKCLFVYAAESSKKIVEYLPGYYVLIATDTTWAIGITEIIYRSVTMLPFICLTVRRLHDIGKKGWWYLPNLLFACLARWLILVGKEGWLYFFILSFIAEIVLAIFLSKDSQVGRNMFGEDPKAQERNTEFRVTYADGIGSIPVPNKEIKESEIEIIKPKVIEKQ